MAERRRSKVGIALRSARSCSQGSSVIRRRPDAKQGAGLDGASVHEWTGLDKSDIWKLIEFMRAPMADAGVGFNEL